MAPNDKALDPQKAKHPNAFVTSSGHTMYKYEGIDGNQIITPKPIEEMSEQDFYDLPMGLTNTEPGRLPQNLTVTFRDPQWAGYWFNSKGQGGARIAIARALGFVPAKIEDLRDWHFTCNDKDGAVTQEPDLVLMKIHKAKMFGKYKEWIDLAKKKGGIDGYKNFAESTLSPANRDKLPYYHTPQATGEYSGLGPVTTLPEVRR
jgi:hypothetical protein